MEVLWHPELEKWTNFATVTGRMGDWEPALERVCTCLCVIVCVRVCLRVFQADQKALAISLRCRASPHSLGGGQISLRCAAGFVSPTLFVFSPTTSKRLQKHMEVGKKRGIRGQGRGEGGRVKRGDFC